MLNIYGSPLSSPTNKVRYVASYLKIPYEFHMINLGKGEQREPAYLKINPYGRVPAIEDNGFTLSESTAIIYYLADKFDSPIHPKKLEERAKVDQWVDFASQHVMSALARIMFNTYFYQFANTEKDERSIQEGYKFIKQYLPIVEAQLQQHHYIVGDNISLADLAMIAALDTVECAKVDVASYPRMIAWREQLMNENFYKSVHESYQSFFNQIMARVKAKS